MLVSGSSGKSRLVKYYSICPDMLEYLGILHNNQIGICWNSFFVEKNVNVHSMYVSFFDINVFWFRNDGMLDGNCREIPS